VHPRVTAVHDPAPRTVKRPLRTRCRAGSTSAGAASR
jgi:hypothetical protein